MSTIINAAPKVILNGIHDFSTRTVPKEPEQIPIHLPQFFTFAEKGPVKNQLISSTYELNRIFGKKTLDYKSKFATHVTPFVNTMLAEGNIIMFKRLVPEDAMVGNLVLNLLLRSAPLPVYRRNYDGTYYRDSFGDLVEEKDEKVNGYSIKWLLTTADSDSPIGSEQVSTMDNGYFRYPILEFRASDPGSFSNNIGIILSVPTKSSKIEPDFNIIDKQHTLMLRFSMVTREDELSSCDVLKTAIGEKTIDFTLKENVVDEFGIEKNYEKILVSSYQDITTPGYSSIQSPIDNIHFYKDNYETAARMVKDAEQGVYDRYGYYFIKADKMDLYEFNIFTGLTPYDIPYYGIQFDNSPSEDDSTISIGEDSILYLRGGDDGTISNTKLDTAVNQCMDNGWDDPTDPLSDMAVNPYSAIWDSGFTLDTKKNICQTLGRRKDVSVMLSTYEHDAKTLNWTEEESMANILKSYASGYPESVIYGTPVCRALVIGGRGYTVDEVWDQPVPLSLDLSQKVAAYMGASNGILKEGKGFDISPNNQITLLRDVTGAYKTEAQRQRDWDAGMVWAQNYNRRSLFYPAVQTVYTDDTSVLNSAINMFIATELEKVCDYVWRNLSGNAKLTSDQFIERSNTMITERTVNRFDNRVIIIPETFYTAADNARGFSWSCNVHMYASNMKTVGTFTIVARRQETLAT